MERFKKHINEIVREFPQEKKKKDPVHYEGWLPGREEDIPKLIKMGATGGLRFNHDFRDPTIEHVSADYRTMIKLCIYWPGIFPEAFTAVNSVTDQQLPYEEQIFWHFERSLLGKILKLLRRKDLI